MYSESQLHWRCRRGVRELDVLFTRFLKENYPSLSDAEKATFQELLEVQDPVIMDWLFDKYQPETPEMTSMLITLRKVFGLK